jgi:hypothetical protein
MLNGANPAGRFGSANVPKPLAPRATFWNWPSITSILPLWKSAAYRKCAPPASPMARAS